MAKKNSTPKGKSTASAYRHTGEKRTNIPPAKIAGEGKVPKVKKAKYYYSHHLSPELRYDPPQFSSKSPLICS